MKTVPAPGAPTRGHPDRRTPSAAARVSAWWRDFGRAPRLMGLDVARALAVLGMMAAHFGAEHELELLRPETWGALVHGRSSLLFAVLAGVSISLMTGRARVLQAQSLPRIRLQLLGRGAVIFAIGLLLELLNTPIAVILTLYGVLYIVAVPCVRWSTTRLLVVGGILALVAPPALAGLQAVMLGPDAPGIGLVLFGTYPITVWFTLMLIGMAIGRLPLTELRTAGALLLVGVLLAALGYGVGSAAASARGAGEGDWSAWESSGSSVVEEESDFVTTAPPEETDFSGLICDAYGDGYVTCYPEADAVDDENADEEWGDEDWGDEGALGGWESYPEQLDEYAPLVGIGDAFFAVEPHSGGSAEVVGSGGFAIAVIGLCLLLARILRPVLLPLAALGSMPLTAYSLHILSYWALAGPLGAVSSAQPLWLWSALALIVLTTAWSVMFGRGPLERLAAAAARRTADPRPDRVPLS